MGVDFKPKGSDKILHEVKGNVKVEHANKAITNENPYIKSVVTDTVHSTVGMKAGTTINLGNFESIRVEVSLFMPVLWGDGGKADLDNAFSNVKTWVDEKMNELIAEYSANKKE